MNTPRTSLKEKAIDIDYEEITLIEPLEADAPKIKVDPYSRFKPIIHAGILGVIALCVWLAMSINTLVLSAFPSDAKIIISNGTAISLFDRYFLLSGTYFITAEHKDYLTFNEKINIDHSIKKEIKLTPKPGSVLISSNAPEAVVFIDGQEVGYTNKVIENVSYGEHTLKIEDRFYETYEGKIESYGKIKLTEAAIELTPSWGDFSLSSTPELTEVWNKDEKLGTSKTGFRLPKGLHTVLIKKSGYKNHALVLDVKPRSKVDLGAITLQKISEKLNVTSHPSGAIITVNGQYQGLTPASIVKPTSSTWDLKLQKQGFQEILQKINADENQPKSLDFTLLPLLGEIVITSNVSGATIFINNENKGKTIKSGNSFSLPSNTQTIRLKKSGYKEVSKRIQPVAGKLQRFYIKLLTHQEHRWAKIPKEYTTTGSNIHLKLFRPNSTFKMGSSRREQGRKPNEYERSVALTKAFYVSDKEITNKQFKYFLPQHSSGNIGGKSLSLDPHPVSNIDWLTAAKFCNWLSKQENLKPFYQFEDNNLAGVTFSKGYRLPTEAEWAWLARYKEGSMARFSWGSNYPPKSSESGNIADSSLSELLPEALRNYRDGYPYSAPVGTYLKNHNGLFDIDGNVAEWIHDFYAVKTGILTQVEKDPMGPTSGDFHVIRGSSWKSGGLSRLRLSFRDSGIDKRNDVGFRIARYVKPSSINIAQKKTPTNTAN